MNPAVRYMCMSAVFDDVICNFTSWFTSGCSDMKRSGAYRFLSVLSFFAVCASLLLFWFIIFYTMMHVT